MGMSIFSYETKKYAAICALELNSYVSNSSRTSSLL